jgi:hypothetical protein
VVEDGVQYSLVCSGSDNPEHRAQARGLKDLRRGESLTFYGRDRSASHKGLLCGKDGYRRWQPFLGVGRPSPRQLSPIEILQTVCRCHEGRIHETLGEV